MFSNFSNKTIFNPKDLKILIFIFCIVYLVYAFIYFIYCWGPRSLTNFNCFQTLGVVFLPCYEFVSRHTRTTASLRIRSPTPVLQPFWKGISKMTLPRCWRHACTRGRATRRSSTTLMGSCVKATARHFRCDVSRPVISSAKVVMAPLWHHGTIAPSAPKKNIKHYWGKCPKINFSFEAATRRPFQLQARLRNAIVCLVFSPRGNWNMIFQILVKSIHGVDARQFGMCPQTTQQQIVQKHAANLVANLVASPQVVRF